MDTLLKTKYTNKLIGNTAFMLLNRPIGQSTADEKSISGQDFAQEIYNQKGLGHDVKVKINSFGGNIFQGWDMVDSIIETKAKTECVGVAYSMAGICLMAGSYRTAYPHSKAMIHGPRRADGKEDNSDFMKGIKDQFVAFLKNHSRFTEEEITDMVTSGKDYYFNAEQMKAKGIVDEIVPSNQYAVVSGKSDVEIYQYCNQLIEQEQNTNTEMEILAKLFGGKSESENLVSAVQMKAENETLKSVKAQLDSEIVALKKENEQLKAEKGNSDKKVKAVELIASAKAAGKLNEVTKEDEAKWIENAVKDFDLVKSAIDLMPGKKASVVATLDSYKKEEGNLTYDWLAKNNPEELARIAEQDPALFNKLSDEYNAKQKEKK